MVRKKVPVKSRTRQAVIVAKPKNHWIQELENMNCAEMHVRDLIEVQFRLEAISEAVNYELHRKKNIISQKMRGV
jgi:hypothetical protein